MEKTSSSYLDVDNTIKMTAHLTDKERHLLEEMLKMLNDDKTLSESSTDSMFTLLKDAILNFSINNDIPNLDESIFENSTSLHKNEYAQGSDFFNAFKSKASYDEKNKKIIQIYLHFMQNAYKNFMTGEYYSERAFAVKLSKDIINSFDIYKSLNGAKSVNLKNSRIKLTNLYRGMKKEHKLLSQKLSNEDKEKQSHLAQKITKKIDKIKNVFKTFNAELLPYIVNNSHHEFIKQISLYDNFINNNDIISFFEGQIDGIDKEQKDNILTVFSEKNLLEITGSDLEKSNLNDLQALYDNLDQTVGLIEKKLAEIVLHKLNSIREKINKNIVAEEEKNVKEKEFNSDLKALIEDIDNSQSIANNIVELNKTKSNNFKMQHDLHNIITSSALSFNEISAIVITDPASSNLIEKTGLKESKFNFTVNKNLFRESTKNFVIDLIEKFHKEATEKNRGERDKSESEVNNIVLRGLKKFLKDENNIFIREIDDYCKKDFTTQEKLIRKNHLEEYVSKKWYSFLGPLAKLVVNKFSKNFKASFAARYEQEKKNIDNKKAQYFDSFKKEIKHYTINKVEYLETGAKKDSILKEFNTHCEEVDKLYKSILVLQKEVGNLIDIFFLNIKSGEDMVKVNNVDGFHEISKQMLKECETRLSYVQGKITDLGKAEAGKLSENFKKNTLSLPEELKEKNDQFNKRFTEFSNSFNGFYTKSTERLKELSHMLTGAQNIQVSEKDIQNISEKINTQQIELKSLDSKNNQLPQDSIQNIVREKAAKNPTIKIIDQFISKIFAKYNSTNDNSFSPDALIDTLNSFMNNQLNNGKVESAAIARPSSVSLGNKSQY